MFVVDVAKHIFMEYDHQRLIQKFGIAVDDSWIYPACLNTPCRISRESGSIEEFNDAGWRECCSYDTVMTIYDILCYHKGDAVPMLSEQWCTVGNFIVTGITQADGFARKYAKLFDGHLAQFTDNGSIVEIFTDLTLWLGIKAVIDRINANALAA